LKNVGERTNLLSTSIKQAFIKSYAHGLSRTGRHAQFAGAAPFLIKQHFHFRPFDVKGACGTNGCAGPALEAFIFIPFNILADIFHFYPDTFQVTNAVLEIFALPAQLKHHKAFFSWIDCCLQDIKGKVKLFYKIYGNRIVDNFFWKSQ